MKFSELYNSLVAEMSSPWPDYSNPVRSAHLRWEDCKNKSKKIEGFLSEQFGEVVVFLCIEKDLNKFFFFVDDNLWGVVDTKLLQNGGIQIKETIKCVSFGLYMSDIFKDYFLENFHYILSDSFHTADGFSLYKRLANDSTIKFTVVDDNTNEEIVLNNSDELEKFYGKGKHNFVYKIQKK